ncbi:MAG: glycosyltransferase [Leptothrix ochracea]|uniref:glycosyltransferase n=2 Tax=Leptothrix ochracea TaxID=735331 RepID=UPI0034E224F7
MKTIDFVYFNAGGGHRASAEALQAVLHKERPGWRIRLVHLFDVMDPNHSFQRITGFAPEDLYNQRLKRGWTLGLAQELKILQSMIRLAHPTLVRRLQQHWLKTEPDLVVSLIPNFNRALFESVSTTLPGVPYVTLLTDLADHPPHFWIEPDQAQHFICGTPKAVVQAREMGHSWSRIHPTSGMILRPDFYQPPTVNRADARRHHGLDPKRPTGLVMFGGHGSSTMLQIARQLPNHQLIFVCGHNLALAQQLQALPSTAPKLVLGFRRDIPDIMHMADFFIGKPGPGSLSEAVHLGLPVIVVRNAWTMPQERYNTDWVLENGFGLVCKRFGAMRPAVDNMLIRLDELRANVHRYNNRAVFEVPAILARILNQSLQAATEPSIHEPQPYDQSCLTAS